MELALERGDDSTLLLELPVLGEVRVAHEAERGDLVVVVGTGVDGRDGGHAERGHLVVAEDLEGQAVDVVHQLGGMSWRRGGGQRRRVAEAEAVAAGQAERR